MGKVKEPITACLKCGGPVWDNRGNKKTKKSPDFRCKDENCEEAFWLDQPKASTVPATERAGAVNIETLYEQSMGVATRRMVAAAKEHPTLGKPTWENVVAATATVFIQACRQGGLGDA